MLHLTNKVLDGLSTPKRTIPVVVVDTAIYGIAGETYPYRTLLKSFGCQWQPALGAWICPSQAIWNSLKEGTIPNVPIGIRTLEFSVYRPEQPEPKDAHRNPDLPNRNGSGKQAEQRAHPVALQDILKKYEQEAGKQ